VKVEQALRLLPSIEALMPLRGLLLSSARPDERVQWGSGGPYLTVGKREIEPGELTRFMGPVLTAVAEHVASLFAAYVGALEAQQRGDAPGAVAALVEAGRLEERVGRLTQAPAWYEVALALAETLQDRRPEVETLLAFGRVCLVLGQYAEGARHYQRALVLAEAEFDQAAAVDASVGLGNTALERDEWPGAQAWYARALRLTQAGNDRLRLGRIEHRLGLLARRRGDLAAAGEHLRRARECLEPLSAGAGHEMARVLDAQGELEAALGRPGPAAAAFREALAWVRRDEPDPGVAGEGLDVTIRLHLAELLLDTGRLLEAEEEMRRAEQLAITSHQTRALVRIYTLLGGLRGRQGDETGFVFFEQAIALCRALEGPPVDEARAYHAYGLFRQSSGGPDEARAYLERAREIFRSLGVDAEVERVEAELQALSA